LRATIDHNSRDEVEPLTLEAEVAAWRNRRALRPESTRGKVQVVRIPKRMRQKLCGSPAGRVLAVTAR
jgi:hypothetical protein